MDIDNTENKPTFTVAPKGSKFSRDFESVVVVTDLSDKDLIDALSTMKVAPPESVFLIDTAYAVFISNNHRMFEINLRVCRPIEDGIDTYNAAWIGLEKFNSYITEEEWISKAKPTPIQEDEEAEAEVKTRFGHQYARVDRKNNPTPLRKPSYASQHDTEATDGDGDE